ncbi:MAG: TIGR03087 family PEP-CTERM/XrtA system glycosyltransferase [Alphaproteobacteria bacterium]|nr:TIGR03087 family PEP-CTERM/XrtA system glycosyltransferase [Alphaproteobacteria bacterium]
MRERREALFLAHRMPYPPDKGDKIRSWRLLQRLARHFDVHVAAFVDDPDDFRHRAVLEGVAASVTLARLDRRFATARSAGGFITGEALSLGYYRDRDMRSRVAALRARPLAVEVAFSSTMAQYLGLPHGTASAPRVVDLCDADSEKWRSYARRKSFPMSSVYEREGRLLACAERDIINAADAAFAVSPAEAAVLQSIDAVARVVDWVGNGVDTDYFTPGGARPADAGGDVVFTGAMDYWANVDAVSWFAREAWPLVRARRPDATFAIVGARPTLAVEALAAVPGVIVTGRVDDVRPYLLRAKAAVAPLRVARGVQNKVLEAMAAGVPVVATTDAAEGLDAEAGRHYLSADEPKDFADAVVGLLGDGGASRKIADAARELVVCSFGWDARLDRFDAVLGRVGAL